MIEVAVIFIISAGAWGLTKAWIRLYQAQAQMLRFHRDRFFKTACAILRDEAADDAILMRMKKMADELDKPGVLYALRRAALTVEQEIQAGTFKPEAKGNFPSNWHALLWGFFLAISYTRPISGLTLRNTLANLIDPRINGLNTDAIDQKASSFNLQPA